MLTLKEHLIANAGLTEEQAKTCSVEIAAFLKAKFPKAMHEEIETILNGGNFGDSFKSELKELTGKAEGAAKGAANKIDELFTELGNKIRSQMKNKHDSK